ncbi:twin-arginine translocation signal domain-containing protein [Vibrio cyclitrophicus]|uniref:Twin-arginine translocation signal domain-containing protein n=1 Tax=Vibrio cyclitrophicus TaxID=47951 RepID=A0ACD5FTJ0_9VIBR
MTNKKESGVMNLTRRGFMKASSAVGSAEEAS